MARKPVMQHRPYQETHVFSSRAEMTEFVDTYFAEKEERPDVPDHM